jgi:hypothetical protein
MDKGEVNVQWENFRVISKEIFLSSNDPHNGVPYTDIESGQSVLVCSNGIIKKDGAGNMTYWALKEQYATYETKNRQGVRRRHKAKRIHKWRVKRTIPSM